MSNEINPYQTPPNAESTDAISPSLEPGPLGIPGPIALAWIGVLLAFGVYGIGFLMFAGLQLPNSIAPIATGVFSVAVLLTPFLRLGWVIYGAKQRRKYRRFWTSGASIFMSTMWVINVVLLCIDAVLIFSAATCFVMLFSQ